MIFREDSRRCKFKVREVVYSFDFVKKSLEWSIMWKNLGFFYLFILEYCFYIFFGGGRYN